MSLFESPDLGATNVLRSRLTLTRAQRYLETGSTAGDDASIYYLQAKPDFRETFTVAAGQLQQVKLFVPYADYSDFRYCALGYSRKDPTTGLRFNRQPPMASGYADWLYLESLDWIGCGTYRGNPMGRLGDQPFWFTPDWVACQATFRPLNDTILSDREIVEDPEPDSEAEAFYNYGCPELARYVVRTPRYVAEERKIGLYGFETYTPGPDTALTAINEPVFVPFRRREIVYVWRQIPLQWVPWAAIDNCAIKVNGRTPSTAYGDSTTETDNTLGGFDIQPNLADTGYERVYPAGTLLFKGLAQEVRHYVGHAGQRLVDLHYLFSYNPYGWNNQPTNDPDSTTVNPVRRRGVSGNKPPYGTADFRTLFKPRAS